MSKYFLILGTLFVVGLLLGLDLGYGNAIGELVFLRPSSRKQESEADYIGLMMMAQACYDPEDAKLFWERMKAAERNAPPQFLSTHPSSDTRIADIERWMPEARQKKETSDCVETLEYADQFRKVFNYTRW
jgi:metalloendopeptidase OMA1, mitochondrial